jgi:hypothetical protein
MRKENFSRKIFLLSAFFIQASIDLNLGFFKVFKCENWYFIQSLATVFLCLGRWAIWLVNINFENFWYSLHRGWSFLTLLSLEMRKRSTMKVIFRFLHYVKRIIKFKWLHHYLLRTKICYSKFWRPYIKRLFAWHYFLLIFDSLFMCLNF